MSANTLEGRVAKLRQEVEKLLAKHTERLTQGPDAPDSKRRELETKRIEVLKRRARQLDKMLDTLQKGCPENAVVY